MLPAYRLKVYRNFKALSPNDSYGIVRYYERHEDGLRSLDFEEFFECTLCYTNALFDTTDYRRHLVMCDYLIEVVIMENVETWSGDDIFQHLLYKKALSLYYLHEYKQAAHVLCELLKIHPYHSAARKMLRRSLLRQKPQWLIQFRAAAVALLLVAAVIIGLERVVVGPFFPAWYARAIYAHNILIFAGLATMIGAEFCHVWQCGYLANKTGRGHVVKM
jgi:hypothetical protein